MRARACLAKLCHRDGTASSTSLFSLMPFVPLDDSSDRGEPSHAGEMPEGSAGQAKWEDVDIKTFVRFAQFVYTGDYSIPRMIVRSSEQPLSLGTIVDEAIPPPDEPQESEFWGSFGTCSKKVKKKSSGDPWRSLAP